jgi:CDP-glucose 4,6-dehydratase
VGVSSNFWQDRPVFVTGGTGLIGGWVLRSLLDRGASPVCLVRDWIPESMFVRDGLLDRVRVVRGKLEDADVVERVLNEYEIPTVLHLAAQTIVPTANRNPTSTFDSNIRGTWQLLEASRRVPTVRQIVVASSDKAYGTSAVLPYTEDMPLAGRHPYDVSKSCADLIAQSYAATYELPVVITRCGNFFGGGDLNWNRLVPGTIRSVIRGERPVIRSDGSLIRDYVYAEDGAAMYLLLAERLAGDPGLAGEAFNFSYQEHHSVLEVTRRILAAMDSDLEPEILGENRGEIHSQYLDAAKARERLGWTPLFTFDEGMRRTVRWYRQFLAHTGTLAGAPDR